METLTKIALLPEEIDVIRTWREAREMSKKGSFTIADQRLNYCKNVIGDANDYHNDKTEIPEED